MKHERLRTFLVSAGLSCAIGIGSAGCFVTGFSFPVESLHRIFLICALWGVLGSAVLSGRRTGWVLSCLLAVCTGFLCYTPAVAGQIAALVERISFIYDSAYGWGVLHFGTSASQAKVMDYPLAIHSSLTALAVSRCVCRRKGYWLSVALGVLPVALCLVVTDMVPLPLYLFVLLAALALLMITGSVRRESSAQANRLVLAAAVPVVLAIGLLFLLNPQNNYVNRTETVRQWMLSRIEDLPGAVEHLPSGGGVLTRQAVDLTALRGQSRSRMSVMEVTSQLGGTVYLRGQDYSAYTGSHWISGEDRVETMTGTGTAVGTVTVRTNGIRQNLFIPSYPSGMIQLSGGRVLNTGRLRQYDCTRTTLAGGTLTDEEKMAYLMLPETTAAAISPMVSSLSLPGTSVDEIAGAVENFVSTSARYDRDTPPMDPEAEDFVGWFLGQSDTGYCVHFASAAVVMLRSLGVPARYVTGYMTVTQPGETTTVTSADAHAWAEYFSDGQWMILEATPAEVFAQREQEWQETEPTALMAPETEAAVPGDGPEQRGEPAPHRQEQPRVNWRAVLAAVSILFGCMFAVWLQRLVRIRLRRMRLRRGTANDQALICWQEAGLLARQLNDPMPEELERLAEKAAYSQHILSAEELARFTSYRRQCIRKIRMLPLLRRLACRYIYALY